jgi:hypothetical protein
MKIIPNIEGIFGQYFFTGECEPGIFRLAVFNTTTGNVLLKFMFGLEMQFFFLVLLIVKHINAFFFASDQDCVRGDIHRHHWVIEIYLELRNFHLEIKQFQGVVACQSHCL